MESIELTYPHGYVKEELPETIAAIGFFDGVHQGHQTVIKEAVQLARAERKTSAVISFHPHPSVVLQKDITSAAYITLVEEKKELLKELGVDRFYLISFTRELSSLPPKEFIDHFIIGLNITHLVAGYDFTFGHKGMGNMENIHHYQQDAFAVTRTKKVMIDGEKASSTIVRAALKKGDLKQVTRILARVFTTTGIVVKGDQRGRVLGYPTANLHVDTEKLLPRQGVYAVTMDVGDKSFAGMANLGLNPTFKNDMAEPVIEVNLFDFDQDIYGETVTVYWHAFIRPEEKFNSAEELVVRMEDDERQVREYFRHQKTEQL